MLSYFQREVLKMKAIRVLSLPQISFAHTYRASVYKKNLSATPGLLEISYVAKGESSALIDGVTYRSQKGDVGCLLRNHPVYVSSDAPHEHHTVGIQLSFEEAEPATDTLLFPTLLTCDQSTAEICHIIDSIIAKQALYKDCPVKGSAKALELLCAIDEIARKTMLISLPSEGMYVQRAKDFIHKNIHLPLTQTAVAEHLGISPGYLCNVFKKTEGITVMRYINTAKLEGIKNLLENERIHLYEAAELFGYTDPNYVSRLYKKLFGYNITDKLPSHK